MGISIMNKPLNLAIVLALAAILAGCTSPPFRSSPDINQRIASYGTILVLPPKVDLYEVSAGGTAEKMDDWSEQGTSNVVQSLKGSLSASRIPCLFLNPDTLSAERKVTLDETSALYDAVDNSILLHAYGNEQTGFAEKEKRFEYSLGPETSDLAMTADAVLVVRGVDYISSSARKAAQAGAMVVGMLFGVVVTPRGGITALSVSLVDAKSGTIVWHAINASEGGFDLRNPASTGKIVASLLKPFPFRK